MGTAHCKQPLAVSERRVKIYLIERDKGRVHDGHRIASTREICAKIR